MKEIQKLDPTLDLSDSVISEIFKIATHGNGNNFISRIEVQSLIETIFLMCAEKQKQNNKGSIYFDINEGRFSFNPNTPTNLNNIEESIPKSPKRIRKIPNEIRENLSLDKISELKFLFQSADKNKRKIVEFSKIKKASKEMANTLRLTENEIDAIFLALKDDDTENVSEDALSEFICLLEKVRNNINEFFLN